MCTLGAKKIGSFFLIKSRDPLEGYEHGASVELVDAAVRKLLVKNSDGVYGGVNSFGVGVIVSSVKDKGEESKGCFIGNCVPALLDARTAEEALEMLEEMDAFCCGNVMIADPANCYVAEWCGSEVSIEDVSLRAVRTNHFVSLSHGPESRKEYPSSFRRFDRALELIRSANSVEDLQQLLKNHEAGPSELSICRHGEKNTTGAFIIDTRNRRIMYCEGHPCEGSFESFSIDKQN